MKVETKLRIERGDVCVADKLDEAFNLVTGHELPEADQKPFGRIRGNDFGMEDAERAVAIVHSRSAQMLKQADTADVFKDPALQAIWAEGQRMAARLAVRKADEFMSALRDDVREATGSND
ncbi:hypothetical protein FJ417_21985 [Mesorhizobium sp. B3-1-7]|uniref:hypothetical protein n=1 Tax=Mesorhizobium sp. B3-1-7 TaxID=2589894 RepID=UPI00112C7DED|nr:hypothetical protein [Mesorhizobium sp. B3-1-7]TPI57445.1 hypothetical protein FJ417_21985 [Mesorhizobium sp. B3-1-7]